MSQGTVRAKVYTHAGFPQLLGTQRCHGDTNDDLGKQRHEFEIKVVFVRSKWPHSPSVDRALPQAACLIHGPLYHQRGPMVRDLHRLNSHGGINENTPTNKAGDTRTNHSSQPSASWDFTNSSHTHCHEGTSYNFRHTHTHKSSYRTSLLLSLSEWFTRELYRRHISGEL